MSCNSRKLRYSQQHFMRKSSNDDVHLTRHAVEMKVLIKQMREQIQNIE